MGKVQDADGQMLANGPTLLHAIAPASVKFSFSSVLNSQVPSPAVTITNVHLHGDGTLPFLQSFRAASSGLQHQLTRLPNRISERTPNFLRGEKQLLNILFKSFVHADLRSLHVQATKSVARRARLNACRCVQLVFGLAWYYAMLCNTVCASLTRRRSGTRPTRRMISYIVHTVCQIVS
jgi:hypothetical protein